MMNRLHKLVNSTWALYHRSRLRRDQWTDRRQLEDNQLTRSRRMIRHAYDYVPYYHSLFRSAGIKPKDIIRLSDLKKIPMTTKQDVQEHYNDIVTRGIDKTRVHSNFTSGSTGTPMEILWDDLGLSFDYGSTIYFFSESGVKGNDNFVTVWGRARSMSRLRGYVRLLGGIRETVLPLLPQERLVDVLRQIEPDVINTFPSVYSSLAGYDVSGITPRLAFTQGEVVTQHCRDVMKELFNLALFETYASVEFGLIAFECSEHAGLHMLTTGVFVEFVDEKGEYVAPGEEGEVVITGLFNRAMPLLRYRIGDRATPEDEECSCGRGWPLIKSVQGRINDFLVLPSGRRISWTHFYHQFYKELEANVFSVSQFQIVQEEKDRIVFRLVKGHKFDPKMPERIKNNMENYFAALGEQIDVDPQIVREISTGRTGKQRILISKLK